MSDPATSRLVAFLRGINLGRRRVKMARLREILDETELQGVATFLASGNVIFDAPAAGTPSGELEARIEGHLEARLEYPVDTFVRPLAALAALGDLDEVEAAEEEGFTPHVVFLRGDAPEGAEEALAALEGPDDRFLVLGSEVVWLRRGGLSDAPITSGQLERALAGTPNTMRNIRTVRRIADRFGG